MIISEILTLLFRPEVLILLGISTAVLVVYNKGKRSGKQQIQDQIDEDKKDLLNRLAKTTDINRKIEREIDEKINASRDASVDELINKFLRLKVSGNSDRSKRSKDK